MAQLPAARVRLLHQRWWFGPSGATAWGTAACAEASTPAVVAPVDVDITVLREREPLRAAEDDARDDDHAAAATGVRSARRHGDCSSVETEDGAGAADMHAGDPTSRPAHAILLCGEGDFSFARALVSAHRTSAPATTAADDMTADADVATTIPMPLFVCTSLDSEATVLSRYPGAARNLEVIRSCGGIVLHEVDATKLTECGPVMDTLSAHASSHPQKRTAFTGRIVVMFQFPHHGGKGKIQVNRKLVRDYFVSAGALARQIDETRHGPQDQWPSEVYVSLAPGQGGTEIDDKAKREWGNSWQVVCCAGDAGLVMRGAFRFDADAWMTLGYAPRGRHSRGLGEFHVDWAVTHVFAPEGHGIRGVCCPTWQHDVGIWCCPSGVDGQEENVMMKRGDDSPPPPFDEMQFVQFVQDHVGSDLLAIEPQQSAVVLLRSEEQFSLRLPVASSEFERQRERFTHRHTYRIIYRASGDRALSKARATAAQLALRAAIQNSDLPVLLT